MTARRGLPLAAPLALALGALTLAACDGASPAGDDLIGQGGDPVVDSLSVADLATVELADYSGGLARSEFGSPPTQTRLLVGRATDPLFGDVTATAYVDFARPALPEELAGQTPASVSLIVPFGAYTYGDPVVDGSFGVAEVTEDWTASADSLAAGQDIDVDEIASTATALPDTVETVTIPLPPSWVTGSDSLLTGADYAERFEGFALVPQGGANAVRGITATGIRLRVVVAEDTLDYPANEVYTRVVTEAPAGTAVRDGSGRALALTLPLDADSLQNSALSQVRLALEVDTVALQSDGLTRPLPSTLALVGVRDDSSRAFLANAAVADGAAVFSGSTVTRVVQEAIFGSPLFERYDVVFPSTPASVDVVPFTEANLVLVRVPSVE